MLDRLTPMIAELTQAVEQEADKCPAAQRLATHPATSAWEDFWEKCGCGQYCGKPILLTNSV
jgi:hypothetical protein